jgi:hypothetical protein
MKKPLLLFLSSGWLLACHKDQNNPVNSWTWFGTQSVAVYNYVLINANQVSNKSDSNEFHIGVTAAFVDSTDNRITGIDNLSVNNTNITPDRDSTYNYDYGTAEDLDAGLALFGTNVNIHISGNMASDTVSKLIYVPKKLSGFVEDYPDTVSRSAGLALHWLPDQQNLWGNVLIQLYYYNKLSVQADSTLPDQINTVNITVPDNGSYRISSKELGPFPVKSYIGISIARGTQNQALLPVSKKRVYFFSSASLSTPPLRVSQ